MNSICESELFKIWTNKYPENKIDTPSINNERGYKLSWLEKFFMSILVLVNYVSIGELKWLIKDKEPRTQTTELWVIARLIILIILVFNSSSSVFYIFFVSYFLIEGFNKRIYIVFDETYKKEWNIRSRNRSLMLLFINYIEMIIGFACLYLSTHAIGLTDNIGTFINDPLDAIYFSLVTITTLGYGEYIPINDVGKILISIETLAGITFLVVVVATFVGWSQEKSDEI